MLRAEVEPEALVQLGDDAGERLQLLRRAARGRSWCSTGSSTPGLALERDLAAAGLLDPVRLHVDVLLHLARQLVAVRREQPAQVPREHVELLEVGVGEGQHLREEGVEPHVVGELAAEVVLLLLGQRLEALDHRREHGVEPVLRRLGVEVDLGEARPRRPRCRPGSAASRRLDLVEQVRVGRLGEQRRLVVRLEGGLDLVGLVGEVEHHRALLVGGCVRLSRESVCTALTPPSFLSTYIVCSSGWSKPVWNLLATIRKRYSGRSNALAVCASGKPFIPASV